MTLVDTATFDIQVLYILTQETGIFVAGMTDDCVVCSGEMLFKDTPFEDHWTSLYKRGPSWPAVCFSFGRLRKTGLVERFGTGDDYGYWKPTPSGVALIESLGVNYE